MEPRADRLVALPCLAFAAWLARVACLFFSFAPTWSGGGKDPLVAERACFLVACAACLVASIQAEKRGLVSDGVAWARPAAAILPCAGTVLLGMAPHIQ